MTQISHCSGVSSGADADVVHQVIRLTGEVFRQRRRAGTRAGVNRDTTTISSAEISVIGTTGSRPSTIVPVAARVDDVDPADRQDRARPRPAAAPARRSAATATASTAAAVQSVAASAPHLVLPLPEQRRDQQRRQRRVAGERVLRRDVEDRLRHAQRDEVRDERQQRRRTARPVCTCTASPKRAVPP